MKQFMFGILVGAMMMGSVVGAASYDRQGRPSAPAGSIEQFDYFRQRQQQLDIGAMRRQMEQQRSQRGINPC